jgi:hypothetical protein
LFAKSNYPFSSQHPAAIASRLPQDAERKKLRAWAGLFSAEAAGMSILLPKEGLAQAITTDKYCPRGLRTSRSGMDLLKSNYFCMEYILKSRLFFVILLLKSQQ